MGVGFDLHMGQWGGDDGCVACCPSSSYPATIAIGSSLLLLLLGRCLSGIEAGGVLEGTNASVGHSGRIHTHLRG